MDHSEAPVDASPIALPRCSGILLHVTSLPGEYGIGDLGPHAYRFADLLADTGQRIWQVLPLVPVGLGNSPYSSPSTFALNPHFISPAVLLEDGWLAGVSKPDGLRPNRVDFSAAADVKETLLDAAFARFEAGDAPVDRRSFDDFCDRHGYWLDDYALFMALKDHHGGAEWTRWAEPYALRKPAALQAFVGSHEDRIRRRQFAQFLAFDQWDRLKQYCNERDIVFFGDLPIYVAHDSADVWAHRELFHLDERGHSKVVAGVPPDYFSETGQRWGNPIYRWDLMEANGFAWWTRRIEAVLQQADLLRLDHFRAFAGYWEIPAREETAVNGRWATGPGAALFDAVRNELGSLPLVAEDLGLITPDVEDLIRTFGFPGMAVMQFAFDEGADHPFLPHMHGRSLVAYTGTHDNDTFVGWWQDLARDPSRERALRFARAYLGIERAGSEEAHWAAIRALMASPAHYVVFPLQDVLGLGTTSRMNTPGRSGGNWTWRFSWDQWSTEVRDRLASLTALYGRSDQLDEAL